MLYELDDFIEEIKAEMLGYEELDDSLVERWDENAREWIDNNVSKKNRIIKKNNSILIEVKDEIDIFNVVDRYYAAVLNEELEQYWDEFTLF